METKVCTYSEPKVRLQLVRIRVETTQQLIIEIRFNRRVIERYTDDQSKLARYRFSHMVSYIVVNRDLSFLLNLTAKKRTCAR